MTALSVQPKPEVYKPCFFSRSASSHTAIIYIRDTFHPAFQRSLLTQTDEILMSSHEMLGSQWSFYLFFVAVSEKEIPSQE